MSFFSRRSPRPDTACHSADVLTPPERATERASKRELEMNYARYQQIEGGLSGIARKVLSFVPMQDAWDAKRIASDIKRQTGASIDHKVLEGCLASLVDCGLVKGTKAAFKRIPVPDAPPLKELAARVVQDRQSIATSQEVPKPEPQHMSTTKPNDSSFLSKVGTLTAKLRRISADSAKLADELDDAALEASKQNEQFEQLRKILKQAID